MVTAYVVMASAANPQPLATGAPGVTLVIQTTAALVGALVAVIAFGRLRQRHRTADLMLVLGLGQLAAGNLLFSVLPVAADGTVASRALWAGMLSRLAGAMLLVAAAFVPAGRAGRPRGVRADATIVVAATALLAAVAWASAAGSPRLTFGGRRVWDAAPGLALLSLATGAALLVAAAGFLRRRAGDELLTWLGVAAVVLAGSHAAFARTYVHTGAVTSSDVLKLACYLLLLCGIVREMRLYWRDHTAMLVAEERRRIARDLHDGLAQELSFVVTTTRRLARRGHDELWDVCSAAERALDESRRAIAALTRDEDDPLDLALAYTAVEVGGRLGTDVTLELAEVAVDTGVKEALVRIAREAITNAARHGRATRVHVRLWEADGEGPRLRVSDNGTGFDVTATPATGRLGITSMRERAASVGGVLTISPARPHGTDVEVALP